LDERSKILIGEPFIVNGKNELNICRASEHFLLGLTFEFDTIEKLIIKDNLIEIFALYRIYYGRSL
jgi:hypothetical protein